MGVNIEDKELVECLIPHWKGETLSFFLVVAINGLICIDTCPREKGREEADHFYD